MTEYLDRVDKCIKILCALLFTGIFFIIILQILFRYLLKSPLVWTEEGARMLFIWLCFLGGTIAHRNQSHIGIDYFTDKFSSRLKFRLGLVIRLFIIFFLIFLCFAGISLAQRSLFMKTITLPWIRWGYIYSSVPVSAFIMLFYSIDEMIRSIRNRQ